MGDNGQFKDITPSSAVSTYFRQVVNKGNGLFPSDFDFFTFIWGISLTENVEFQSLDDYGIDVYVNMTDSAIPQVFIYSREMYSANINDVLQRFEKAFYVDGGNFIPTGTQFVIGFKDLLVVAQLTYRGIKGVYYLGENNFREMVKTIESGKEYKDLQKLIHLCGYRGIGESMANLVSVQIEDFVKDIRNHNADRLRNSYYLRSLVEKVLFTKDYGFTADFVYMSSDDFSATLRLRSAILPVILGILQSQNLTNLIEQERMGDNVSMALFSIAGEYIKKYGKSGEYRSIVK